MCSLSNVRSELVTIDLSECREITVYGLTDVLRYTNKLREISIQGLDWRIPHALKELVGSYACQYLRFVWLLGVWYQCKFLLFENETEAFPFHCSFHELNY